MSGFDEAADILRNIRVEANDYAKELARRYGYLPYMVQRYIHLLGEEGALRLLEAFERRLSPVIRCNDTRVDCEWLRDRLEGMGFRLSPIGWSRGVGYRVAGKPPRPSIGATHEYLKGYYYVHRDAAPLAPPIILYDLMGDDEKIVFDACAGPGGKATHLAQLLHGEGVVVANDIALYRVRAIMMHLLRMRLWNMIVTWSDLRKLPAKKTRYRWILLDVPCSAEGTIMLDPGRKRRTTLRDLAAIVSREIALLDAAARITEPGGYIVYVTCSIAPEENEYVVTRVLDRHRDMDVAEPRRRLFDWSRGVTRFHRLVFDDRVERCVRIYPHLHGMIGMTICILHKTG